MQRCPLCRAMLNGNAVCRRCRAELQSVIQAEHDGQMLTDAASYWLSLGDVVSAEQMLRRALSVHATPEVRALWRLVETLSQQSDARDGPAGDFHHSSPTDA